MFNSESIVKGVILVSYLPLMIFFGYYGASILEKYGKKNKLARYIGYTFTIGFTPLYIGSFLMIYEFYTSFIVMIIIVYVLYIYEYNRIKMK